MIDVLYLLPEDNEVSGFTGKGSPDIMTDEGSIFDAINGAANVYIERGFVEGIRKNYSNGSVEIEVRIFNQGKNSNAGSLYDYMVQQEGSGEMVVDEGEQKRIFVSQSGFQYNFHGYCRTVYIGIVTFEKNDFILNIGKQFCFNIFSKIDSEE
ncbi:MAG: hypothetical protein ABIA63_13120 [bacterium]